MALKYSITHNGNTWNSSTDVSSISLSNGSVTSSITSTGTRTLNCAGKYMNNNLVIGAKTLNCKGKIMSGNVVISAQNSVKFISVGASGSSCCSTDGVNWTSLTGLVGYNWVNVAHNNGNYLAACEDSWSIYMLNGTNWQTVSLPAYIYHLFCVNNKFIAIYRSNGTSYLKYSTNGTTWTDGGTTVLPWAYLAPKTSAYFNSNCYIFDGRIGSYGSTLYKSTDGISWSAPYAQFINEYTSESRPKNLNINGVACGLNKIICVGQIGDSESSTYGSSYYSSDGTTWQLMSGISESESLKGVAYGNNRFVAFNDYGSVFYSDDGVSWISAGSPLPRYQKHITFGGDRFVTVGQSGQSYYSTNGINWNPMGGLSSSNQFAVTSGS